MTPETKARKLDVCSGCGEFKAVGLIVCWECFKYRTDVKPFKYADMTLLNWLKLIPANWKMKIAQSGL